jgi:RHH-type proline utilization regulon transcriptional repressor/proline dehydrogenase/delta 1-pyrroline-5-carboxylate dehydrogenase
VSATVTSAGAAAPFANEPILELRRADARDALAGALTELDPRLPLEVPALVGGDSRTGEGIASTDPGRPDRLVASAAVATEGEVAEAVGVAAGGRARRGSPGSRVAPA